MIAHKRDAFIIKKLGAKELPLGLFEVTGLQRALGVVEVTSTPDKVRFAQVTNVVAELDWDNLWSPYAFSLFGALKERSELLFELNRQVLRDAITGEAEDTNACLFFFCSAE